MSPKLRNVFSSGPFWLAMTVAYLTICAAIFNAVDHENWNETFKFNVSQARSEKDRNFSSMVLEKYNLSMKYDDFRRFYRDVKNHVEKEQQKKDWEAKLTSLANRGLYKWFYFCFITLTTVGYGDIYPISPAGKGFLIPFAIIGIPLMMATLGILGYQLTSLELSVSKRFNNSKNSSSCYFHFWYLSLFNFVLFGIVFLAGAAMTSYKEGWTFFVACYYWFVFFTTIGYGDVLVKNSTTSIGCYVGWMLYRYIGLVLLSAILMSLYRFLVRSPYQSFDIDKCEVNVDKAGDQNEPLNNPET